MKSGLSAAVLFSSLLLAGCTDADWANVVSFSPSPAQEYPVGATPVDYRAATASPSATATCSRAARERSQDAAVQQFDETVQQQVRDSAYADCMKWAARATAG
ncbi:MAG TPA: hypothetical protein VNU97_07480 [Rhizomicrobium sp.]|nr:hypothetical protein [Rhizomicrobium sp.]